MNAILFAAIIGGLILLIWKIMKSYLKMLNTIIPGPRPIPIVGNSHILKTSDCEFYKQILAFAEEYKEHGLFRLMVGSHTMIFLTKAETAETLLSSSTLITKSTIYKFLHPWLNTGLLTSTGKKWQQRRKLLTPSFHFSVLQNFVTIFNEQAVIFVQQLKKHLNEKEFDVSEYVTRCTLDVICETAMGKQLNCQSNRNLSYLESVQRLKNIYIN